jgi:hypothetical protein
MIKKSKDPNAIEEMKSRITWIVRITSYILAVAVDIHEK